MKFDPAVYPVLTGYAELHAALLNPGSAVLTAPPGAGKSTALVLQLLLDPAFSGKIVMLEPRRVAARAIAGRLAALLGEPVGRRVGYRVRGEVRVSAATRLELLTEGLLTRRLQQDPGLDGVELVIFDEFHERSLAADLALALTCDVRSGLRPDLKVLVMSATLEAEPVAALLDQAPVISIAGRRHPLEIVYGESAPAEELARVVARTTARELSRGEGGVLVFLPGAGEIAAVEQLLRPGLPPAVELYPLYGNLDARTQDRAVAPAAPGFRKVVLATNLAETSLTIDGVTTVVDSGWERRLRFDPGSGLPRLELARISRSSADQRAGRAGRTGPGRAVRCYNLWEYQAFPERRPPEILSAELSGLALELAAWGAEVQQLRWLDPPPESALGAARALLTKLGALMEGRLTPRGRELVRLGVHPRLGTMLLRARDGGCAPLAAELAALLEEHDWTLEQVGVDLRERLERFRAQPERHVAVLRLRDQLLRLLGERYREGSVDASGLLLAYGYPDRIGRARERHGAEYTLSGGRSGKLPGGDELCAHEFLVVPQLDGAGADGRIQAAAPLSESELRQYFGDQLEERTELVFEEATGRVRAERLTVLGALVLTRKPLPQPPSEALRETLLAALPGRPLRDWIGEESLAYLERLAFAARTVPDAYPALEPSQLLVRLRDFFSGQRSLEELRQLDWKSLLGYDLQQRLEREFPARWTTPGGSRLKIDYTSADTPVLAVRVQELFGLTTHPGVGPGGRLPLRLELLSPAGRPIQITSDLPGFWRGSWALVRREMRSRYPKHRWPEDPASAVPGVRLRRTGE